jgi:phosphoglycolate phosphatase-like HAD superfamily hydrolase
VRRQQQLPKLILFDMDHTLVDVGEQHQMAYQVALRTAYGFDGQPDIRLHQGQTQPNIIRMICRDHGLSQKVTENGLAQALRLLSEVTISLLDHDLRSAVLPGVRNLLDALENHGHTLGLVTGRAEQAARAILERSSLQRHFQCAAFGDEGETREDLLRLAIQRSVRPAAFELGQDGLVVVGDAPLDLQAAHALGARAIAVATGHHTMDELAQYRPAAVLPHFKDWQAALAVL